MDKNSLVSVIVPAYNVEPYIDHCIQSILNQKYQDIEVIIVDDGSKDKTYFLSQKWEMRDNRVKVVTQENQGSGPARNRGLDLANGRHIMFVDPDDWIDEELVGSLIEKMCFFDVDLVVSGCINDIYEDGLLIDTQSIIPTKQVVFGKENVRKEYLRLFNNDILLAPTRALYKKSIIDKHNVKFPNLRRSQDIVFNYRYYKEIASFAILDVCYYHYRFDVNEISSKVKPDYYKSISHIFTDVKQLCIEWGIDLGNDDFFLFCNHFYSPLLLSLALAKSNNKVREIVSDMGIRNYVSYMQTMMKSFKANVYHNLIMRKKILALRIYVFFWKQIKMKKIKGFS